MLSLRLISAACLVSGIILCVYADYWLGQPAQTGRPGIILGVLAILSAAICAGEMTQLFRGKCPGLSIGFSITVGGLIVAICCVPIAWRHYPVDCQVGQFGWMMIALTAAVGLAFLFEMVRFGQLPNSTDRIARYALIFAYLILLFGFLIAHRRLHQDNLLGAIAVICLFTTVKMSDAAAYFTGITLGKRKLAPKLSPGKTVEGALGSIVGGWLGAAIIIFLVAPLICELPIQKHWWWFLVYGAVVTLFGILGDLAESLLKRDAEIKDSSSWIPGMGGFLDVVDSLVFTAPVSYFLWLLGDLPAAS